MFNQKKPRIKEARRVQPNSGTSSELLDIDSGINRPHKMSNGNRTTMSNNREPLVIGSNSIVREQNSTGLAMDDAEFICEMMDVVEDDNFITGDGPRTSMSNYRTSNYDIEDMLLFRDNGVKRREKNVDKIMHSDFFNDFEDLLDLDDFN